MILRLVSAGVAAALIGGLSFVRSPPLAAAANAPAGLLEANAASRHAELAYQAADINSARANLQASIDCLVGPNDSSFKAVAGNPCAGLGQGAIRDVRDKSLAQRLRYAVAEASQGLRNVDLTGVRMSALSAMDYLESIQIADPSIDNSTGSAAFTVTSPTLSDGAFISTQDAANAKGCGGQNISPPVQWSNPPVGTRSFAVTMFDPDGAKGLGVTHWMTYDIPMAVRLLPRDMGGVASNAFVGGMNSKVTTLYSGPCPAAGDQPHHYIIAVYALDLAVGTLKAGLDRNDFLAAIRGHSLAEASIVVRYER